MKVLLCSSQGELLPWGCRLAAAGHKVLLHISNKRFQARGEGLLPKSRANTLVDSKGKPVKASIKQLMAEHEPDKVVCDVGMGAVADYLDAPGASKWGDFVSTDATYMRKIMEQGKLSDDIAAGAVWDGDTFTYFYDLQLAVGLFGPDVGIPVAMGCAVRKRERSGLEALEPILRKVRYKGPLAVYKGILSVGYMLPFFAAFSEIVPAAVFFDEGKMYASVGCSVRVSLPPYPHATYTAKLPFTIDKELAAHFWPVDVDSEGASLCGGQLGWVSAYGVDMVETSRRIHRTLTNLTSQLPTLQYRPDLVDATRVGHGRALPL